MTAFRDEFAHKAFVKHFSESAGGLAGEPSLEPAQQKALEMLMTPALSHWGSQVTLIKVAACQMPPEGSSEMPTMEVSLHLPVFFQGCPLTHSRLEGKRSYKDCTQRPKGSHETNPMVFSEVSPVATQADGGACPAGRSRPPPALELGARGPGS